MAWRDQLRDASFRGVPFWVEGATAEFGRRTVVHEYPYGQRPGTEDLGRRVRRLRLDAFVVGANYMANRDRLRAALEQAGPGRLVHPFWGELQVSVEAVSLRETTSEGGRAVFGLSFVEHGDELTQATRLDTAARVRQLAGVAEFDALAARVLKVSDSEEAEREARALLDSPQPADVERGALLQSALSFLLQFSPASVVAVAEARTIGRVRSAVELLERIGRQTASLSRQPGAVNSQSALLLSDVEGAATRPALLAFRLAQLTTRAVAASLSSETDPESDEASAPPDDEALAAAIAGVSQTWQFGDGDAVVAPTTPRREVESRQQAAIRQFIRSAAVAVATAVVGNASFVSWDEARKAADSFSGWLTDLERSAASHQEWAALADLRGALVAHLQAEAGRLPRLSRYVPPQTTNALALAYRLYGDASRAGEIVRRNALPHPGFVPGGVPLEVLSE